MGSAECWAVDTSVAIAALDSAHLAHPACLAAVRELRPALAGHAAFSVLTRLPGALAVDPGDADALLRRVFGEVAWLGRQESADLLGRQAPLRATGTSCSSPPRGSRANSPASTT